MSSFTFGMAPRWYTRLPHDAERGENALSRCIECVSQMVQSFERSWVERGSRDSLVSIRRIGVRVLEL